MDACRRDQPRSAIAKSLSVSRPSVNSRDVTGIVRPAWRGSGQVAITRQTPGSSEVLVASPARGGIKAVPSSGAAFLWAAALLRTICVPLNRTVAGVPDSGAWGTAVSGTGAGTVRKRLTRARPKAPNSSIRLLSANLFTGPRGGTGVAELLRGETGAGHSVSPTVVDNVAVSPDVGESRCVDEGSDSGPALNNGGKAGPLSAPESLSLTADRSAAISRSD